MRFTSSKLLAKKAFKNPAKLKSVAVKKINKNAKNGCTKVTDVKKCAIIKTIIEIKNPLTTHPLKNQRIIEVWLSGELIISSMLFWNFAPKNELATFI